MAVKEIRPAFNPHERLEALLGSASPEVQASVNAWKLFLAAPAPVEAAAVPPAENDGYRPGSQIFLPDEGPGKILWHYLCALVKDRDPDWFLQHGHVAPERAALLQRMLAAWREQDAFLAQASAWLDANPHDPRSPARREDYCTRLDQQWYAGYCEIADLVGVPGEHVLYLLQGEVPLEMAACDGI